MGLLKSIVPFIVFLEDESSVFNYLVAADILVNLVSLKIS